MGIKKYISDLKEASEKREYYFTLYCEGSLDAAKSLTPFSQVNREGFWSQYIYWRSKEERLTFMLPWKILFYKGES